MARPREFDESAALDRATQLFWQRGYEATSVQDLVEATGVHRASLYATFGDKAALFERVLERYGARTTEALTRALAPPAAGRDAAGAYLRTIVELATPSRGAKGCLVLNTVTGCATAPPPLLDRVTESVRATTDAITEALARDPALARRPELPALARFVAAHGHGLAVQARAGVKRPELLATIDVALRAFDPGPPGR